MTFGISRVHGAVISPKNLAGVSLQDYTLTFLGPVATTIADQALAGGAFDQVFRTAVGTIASVSRIGTLNTSTGAVRFAIEVLGAEASDASGTGSYLGTGPTDASPASTAAALQAAVQALGTVTNSAGGVIGCGTATVVAFVY